MVYVVYCNELVKLGYWLGVVDENERLRGIAIVGVVTGERRSFVGNGTGEAVLQPMGLAPVGRAGDENDASSLVKCRRGVVRAIG